MEARCMTLRIEIVDTPRRLAEVSMAWDALWSRGDQSIFQSHGWISAWSRARQTNDKSRLCVGLCWLGSDLVAAMPFATRRHRGVRVLEWAAKDCSDYCDALVDPGFAEAGLALEQVWVAVVASGRFDLAYLSHVRPDAAFHNLLNRPRRSLELRPSQRSARSLQVRNGAANGQAWFHSLGKAAQDKHTSGLHTLAGTGPVVVTASKPGDVINAVLERIIALKQQWLMDRGQSNTMLGDNAAVLRALVKELDRRQALQLFSIHCGDLLVAALLNIAAGARRQIFFAAYDPQFDQVSPETLIMVEYLIRTFNTQVSEIDLLCVEDEHELGFANARVDLASFVGTRTLVGKLALAIGERLDRGASP